MAEKGIRTVWIDSDSAGVLGTKVYRDGVLIATVPFGTLEYKDPTAEVGIEYKYVTQAYTIDSESTDETEGINMDYYTIGTADFRIISYNISEETNTTAKVQVYMTEQCSINYYVNGVKNAASSDDFNAGEIGPDEFRHTRTLTDLPAGQTSNLIIELTAESNLQVIQSDEIPLTTTGAPSVDSFPRLINFRVEEANKDRILFDSTADASGLTSQGFLLSTSRTVTEVVLDVGGLGGYLTVSSDYTYWENDKVNLVGGDGTVLDFTFEHILSNIDEPAVTSERFVSVSGGGDGLSIGSPYSFANIAGDNAEGRKFWIEKGNYGDIWANGTQGRLSSKNGTESAPMWLEGYTNTPGDIANRDILDNFTYTSMAQAEADAFDDTTYPVFAGATEQVSSYGIYFRASSYWIVKNLQIKGFQDNILLGHATGLDAASNIQVRNCSLGLAIGDTGENIGGGFLSGKGGTTELKSQNTRVTETLCIDNMAHGIRFHGARELAYDNAVYCGTPADQYEYTTDYYYSLYGGSENGIVKNNYAARVIGVIGSEYSGHSFGTKGDAGNSNGLFDGNQALNIGENLFAAYIDTYGFVFKNNSVVNVNVSGMEGLVFRDGAHDCIWENNYIEGAGQGCSIWKSRENYPPDVPANDYAARNGIIRNNIFNGGSSLLVSNNKNSIPEPDVDVPHIIENIKFYNNTVYNFTADLFYFNITNDNDLLTWVDCEFKNNIVHTVANELSTGASTDDYDQQQNLYYDCTFTMPVGADNRITPNPDFTDIVGGDFTPLAPFSEIQVPRLADALSGYEWEARQSLTTLGAVLSAEETPGVVVPTVTVSNTDGTADFSTVQEAVDSGLVAGDIVGLKGGDEFYENVHIQYINQGDVEPFILTSYGTGQATITANKTVTGWADQGGNIWTVSTGTDEVYQVMKDDKQLTKARFPNPIGKYAAMDNYLEIDSTTDGTHFICADLIGVGDLVGGSAQILTQDWVLSSSVITAFNNTTGEVTLGTSLSLGVGRLFFVNNAIDLVDEQDQWYYESNVLTMYSVGEPENIEISTIDEHGIEVENSGASIDNITIKGFYQKGIYANRMNNGSTTRCNFIGNYESAEFNHNSDNDTGTFDDNYITGSCIGYTNYDKIGISRNTFKEIGLYNMITEKGYGKTDGYGGSNGSAIDAPNGLNIVIEDNICEDLGYAGISFSKEYASVRRNIIRNFNLTVHDGGAIYTWTGDFTQPGAEFSVIENNIIDGYPFNSLHWGSQGIYLDGQTHDVTVQYNTVISTKTALFWNQNRRNIGRYNNLFESYEEGLRYSSGFDIGVPADKNTSEYNNVYLSKGDKYGIYVISSIANNDDTHISDFNNIFNSQALNQFGIKDDITPTNLDDWDYTPLRNSLSDWQALTTQESNTTVNTTMFYETIFSNQGSNVIVNGEFEENVDGWITQGCTKTWTEHPEALGTYYLYANNPTGNSRLRYPITTTVIENETWVLKFRAKVTDNRTKYSFRIFNAANTLELHTEDIFIDEDWCDKQIIFTAPSDDTGFELNIILQANVNDSGFQDLSLDNVEMYTATVTEDKKALCEYNDTNITVVRNLPSGTWKAMSDGTEYIGTITLTAFSSEILLKQ